MRLASVRVNVWLNASRPTWRDESWLMWRRNDSWLMWHD